MKSVSPTRRNLLGDTPAGERGGPRAARQRPLRRCSLLGVLDGVAGAEGHGGGELGQRRDVRLGVAVQIEFESNF